MGLCIMAIIAGAVAALTGAVSTGWEASESTQAVQIGTRQIVAQLQRLLRDGKYVGLATKDGQLVKAAGSTLAAGNYNADIMFWSSDTNGDLRMQLSEMALIEHDISSKTLRLYQIPSTATNAATVCTVSDISSTDAAIAFKALPNCAYQTIATGVTAASFAAYQVSVSASGQRPSVEFALTFSLSGPSGAVANNAQTVQARLEYGTATLRSPTTQP